MELEKIMFKVSVAFLVLFLFSGNSALGWYDIEEPPPFVEKSTKQAQPAPSPKATKTTQNVPQTQPVKPEPTKINPPQSKPVPNNIPKPLEQVLAGSIYGKVVSGEAPLVGAVVTLNNGMTAVTDAKGEYTIQNIAPGQYSIYISMGGFNTATGTLMIETGATRRVLSSLSPDYMPPNNVQLRGDQNPTSGKTIKSTSSSRRSKSREEKKEHGFITVKVDPQRDLYGGFRDRGKIWWVYSIKVEQVSGSLRWSDTYDRPSDRNSTTRELFCRGAIVGEEYRIEIEWRDVRSRDSRTRHWVKKMDTYDEKFTFDSPSY